MGDDADRVVGPRRRAPRPLVPDPGGVARPPRGAPLSEYWHPGAVRPAFFDIDGDGEDELLLGGVNNPGQTGMGHPSLAVLQMPFQDRRGAENFFGSSNHRELTYRLFPRPDVFEIQNLPVSVLDMQIITSSGHIKLGVGYESRALLVYYLDAALEIVGLYASDNLVSEHDRLHLEGLLDHRYSAEHDLARWRHLAAFETAPDGNSLAVRRRLRGTP